MWNKLCTPFYFRILYRFCEVFLFICQKGKSLRRPDFLVILAYLLLCCIWIKLNKVISISKLRYQVSLDCIAHVQICLRQI